MAKDKDLEEIVKANKGGWTNVRVTTGDDGIPADPTVKQGKRMEAFRTLGEDKAADDILKNSRKSKRN